MAEDKGGTRYTIEVVDAFSKNVDLFKAKIGEAESAFNSFADAASKVKKVGQETASSFKQAEDETVALAKAQEQLNKSFNEVAGSTSTVIKATKSLVKERDKQAVQQVKANIEEKRSFDISGRIITDLEARAIAHRKLAAALNKQKVAQQSLIAAEQLGIKTTDDLRKKAGLLTEQEKEHLKNLKLIEEAQKRTTIAARERREEEEKAQRVALKKAILDREAKRAEEQRLLSEAKARNAANIQKQAEIENEQRIAALRKNITDRHEQSIRQEKLLQDASVKASDARRKALEPLTGLFSSLSERANRTSFTFRRLFGILAAFTVARKVVQVFVDLVGSMVSLNAELEQTRLGIASLFTAVGTVFDAKGRIVKGAEALNLASKEADRQIKLLRKDGLATVATFEQLAETFQTAVGPGLRAGLNIDQIRAFTIQISQAASAIGLEQNKLAEEIRSILSGTVSIRTTRIAAVLGITNEDIRLAREAGTLVAFLNEKFQAFTEAGKEAQNTFPGLMARLKNAFQLTVLEGGAEFFSTLKTLIRDFADELVTTDALGGLKPSPEAILAVKRIGEGLKEALKQARELATSLGFKDIQDLGQAIGNAIAVSARAGRVLIQAFITAFRVFERTLIRPLNALTNAKGTLGDIIGRILGGTAAAIVLGGVFTRIFTTIGSIGKGVFALIGLMKNVGSVAAVVRAIFVGMTGPVGILLAALVTIGTLALPSLFADTTEKVEETASAADDLKKTYEELSPLITGINGVIEDQADNIKNLDDELKKAVFEFQRFARTLGVSSGISNIINEQLSGSERVAVELRELNDAVKTSEQTRSGLLKRRIDLQNQLIGLDQKELADTLKFNSLQEKKSELLKKHNVLQDEFNFLSSRILGGTAKERTQQLAFDEKRKQTLEAQNQTLKEQFSLTVAELSNITTDEATRTRILALMKDIEETSRQLLAADKAQTDALTAQAEQLVRIRSLQAQRTIQAAQAASFDAEIDVARRTTELQNQEAVQRNILGLNVQRIEAENQIRTIRTELSILEQQQARDVEANNFALEEQRNRIKEAEKAASLLGVAFEGSSAVVRDQNGNLITATALTDEQSAALLNITRQEEALRAIQEQINNQSSQHLLTEAELTRELGEQERIAQRSTITIDNALFGFVDGIRQFNAQVPTIAQGLSAATSQFLTDFSSSMASTITTAIATGTSNLREAMANLLLGLANNILNLVIQNVLSQLLSSLFGAAVPMLTAAGIMEAAAAQMVIAANTMLLAGFHKGGQVGFHKGGDISSAFNRAKGYATGGLPTKPHHHIPRPPIGLHKTDTIPIWAAPGEWVIQAKSAAKYGRAVMDSINRGMIDPTTLTALAGVQKSQSRVVKASRGPGFASGGLISSTGGDSKTVPLSNSSNNNASTPIAVVAPSEENLRRMLSGGRNAMLRFIRDNKQQIGPLLK